MSSPAGHGALPPDSRALRRALNQGEWRANATNLRKTMALLRAALNQVTKGRLPAYRVDPRVLPVDYGNETTRHYWAYEFTSRHQRILGGRVHLSRDDRDAAFDQLAEQLGGLAAAGHWVRQIAEAAERRGGRVA